LNSNLKNNNINNNCVLPFLQNGKDTNEDNESIFSKNSNLKGKKNLVQKNLYPFVLKNGKNISEEVF